jgi:hypothetical protein
MNGPLQLPARFNGEFGLVLYHQHHGVLLLRSADRDDGGPRRLELLFKGVVWMSLPAWFSDFTIEQCLIDEVLGTFRPVIAARPIPARCTASTSIARLTTSSPAACWQRVTTAPTSIRHRCCRRSRFT